MFLAAVCILAFTVCGLNPVYGEAVSSKELIDNTKEMNGKTVVYTGEVVTAIMDRGENSWINLNDGDNAIGIWCARDLTRQITYIGNYKNRGDIVEVEGVFNCACPVHNGDLDIHAGSLKIVKAGYLIKKQLNIKMVIMSVILFILAFIAAVISNKRK